MSFARYLAISIVQTVLLDPGSFPAVIEIGSYLTCHIACQILNHKINTDGPAGKGRPRMPGLSEFGDRSYKAQIDGGVNPVAGDTHRVQGEIGVHPSSEIFVGGGSADEYIV